MRRVFHHEKKTTYEYTWERKYRATFCRATQVFPFYSIFFLAYSFNFHRQLVAPKRKIVSVPSIYSFHSTCRTTSVKRSSWGRVGRGNFWSSDLYVNFYLIYAASLSFFGAKRPLALLILHFSFYKTKDHFPRLRFGLNLCVR